MRSGAFSYSVSVRVTFTAAEVETLMRCSARHYDATCRKASQQGGFVYGLNNLVTLGDTKSATDNLDFRALDTLAKITEDGKTRDEIGLHYAIRKVLDRVRDETMRVNNVRDDEDSEVG